MSERREFLKYTVLTALFSSVGSKLNGSVLLVPPPEKKSTAVVISTWDFGKEANEAAWIVLNKGGRALDAVEAGARIPEADPDNQSVGYGGRPDREGKVTLDASIMNEKGDCGAVTCLEQIMHPISVARLVMEKTPHVMLSGEGALQFAVENGFKREELLTSKSEKEYKKWLKKSKYEPVKNIENISIGDKPGGEKNHDTIGILALDKVGNLSGACTTSGMAYKMRGRVGDSPIIGAGLFVDNEIGAATSSGLGEEVIKIVGSHLVVELMRQGNSPENACKIAVERIAKKDPIRAQTFQVGFIAVNKNGETGAFALCNGFTYAVKTDTETTINESKYLFKTLEEK